MFPADAIAALLPHLERIRILEIYDNAPGSEIRSGKFANPASSAALAANVFGWFLTRPAQLRLPESIAGDEALSVKLEAEARFPWSGGRHPSLDALLEFPDRLIGVEAKRYEPFRSKGRPVFSDAFDRDVWAGLAGYNEVRCRMASGTLEFKHLDAAQLVKHALGLKTAADRIHCRPGLCYLYAEPKQWPDGRQVSSIGRECHRAEIDVFASLVGSDEVTFHSMSYTDLLTYWQAAPGLADHADAVLQAFDL